MYTYLNNDRCGDHRITYHACRHPELQEVMSVIVLVKLNKKPTYSKWYVRARDLWDKTGGEIFLD